MVLQYVSYEIVNPKSNFVVCTYWWGRGNKNKNTQRPCPDEIEPGDKLWRKPVTYDDLAVRFIKACREAKVNYYVAEVPEFAQKGGYQKAINYKPTFIIDTMKHVGKRNLAYIDSDMIVHHYPALFDLKGYDFMCYMWSNEPRQTYEQQDCFNPWSMETSGGFQYFGNTKNGKLLLNLWEKEVSANPGKADDRLLSAAFMKSRAFMWCKCFWLPFEYLYFGTEVRRGGLANGFYRIVYPAHQVISHPECLTAEELAADLGAASNRYPTYYKQNIGPEKCIKYDGIMYEDLFINQKRQSDELSGIRRSFKQHKIMKWATLGQKMGGKDISAGIKLARKKLGSELPSNLFNKKRTYLHVGGNETAKVGQVLNVRAGIAEGADIGLVMLWALKWSKEVVLLPTLDYKLDEWNPLREYDMCYVASDNRRYSPPNVKLTKPLYLKKSNLSMSLMRQWSKYDRRVNLGEVMRNNPYTTLAMRIHVKPFIKGSSATRSA